MKFRFENLQVWQDARNFINQIYTLTKKFPASEKFALIDQLRRATVSIALNITEGSDRKSDLEFSRYLRMAITSTEEVVTALYIALDQKYISQSDFDTLYKEAHMIVAKLNALINSLRSTDYSLPRKSEVGSRKSEDSRHQRGFTLVELLVAISIIAVLSTVGLATFSGIQAKARDAVRKNDLNALATALSMYREQNGQYIVQSDRTDITSCPSSSDTTSQFYTLIAPNLSTSAPKDPKTGSLYCYISESRGRSFRLFAKLEDCISSSGNLCRYTNYNHAVFSEDLSLLPVPGDRLIASAPTASPTPTPSPTPSPSPSPSPTPTPHIFRDDDDTREISLYIDFNDDYAIKSINVLAGVQVTSPKLWVYGKGYDPRVQDSIHTIKVNNDSSKIISFNPIDKFGTDWSWQSFDIPSSWINTGRINTFDFRDTNSNWWSCPCGWQQDNLEMGIDTTGKTTTNSNSSFRDFNGSSSTRAGELMIYLDTAPPSPTTASVTTSPTPSPSPTPAPTALPASTLYKRVFVTSTMYDGNLGGLSGTDTNCQVKADGKGLGGTWKAWLSSDSTEARVRLSQATVPYKLLDGTIIAQNWTDLTDGTLLNPIKVDEDVVQRSCNDSDSYVWTGSTALGYKAFSGTGSSGSYCVNWTSVASGYSGRYGYCSYTNSSWTDTGAQRSCNTVGHLYCFEQ